MPVEISVTSPAPRVVWEDLMRRDPEALPYQSPAWVDSICASGRWEDASRHYQFSDGQEMVLPMVRRAGLAERLAPVGSMPGGWGMGGALSSDEPSADRLRVVFADLAGLSSPRVTVRPNPRLGPLWAAAAPSSAAAIPRLAHAIDLRAGFDHVWSNGFSANTRNAVRRAERAGIEVERDDTGRLIPVFYELLLRSFDRWAGMQHEPRALTRLRGRLRDPLGKFEAIAGKLGGACRVWLARVEGRPAAAILVLQYANVNDARGAIDKELVGKTGANDLIQKLAIEEACRAGCRYYHMGETGSSASLALYKKRFGAEPCSYFEYRIERLPLTRVEQGLRRLVKTAIGFRDPQ